MKRIYTESFEAVLFSVGGKFFAHNLGFFAKV